MSLYDLFRDTAAWEAVTGGETYPGRESLGAPATVTVRDLGLQRIRIAEDRLERRVFWLLPDAVVKAGDRLAGARVDQVLEAKDAAGNVQYRIAYAEA